MPQRKKEKEKDKEKEKEKGIIEVKDEEEEKKEEDVKEDPSIEQLCQQAGEFEELLGGLDGQAKEMLKAVKREQRRAKDDATRPKKVEERIGLLESHLRDQRSGMNVMADMIRIIARKRKILMRRMKDGTGLDMKTNV